MRLHMLSLCVAWHCMFALLSTFKFDALNFLVHFFLFPNLFCFHCTVHILFSFSFKRHALPAQLQWSRNCSNCEQAGTLGGSEAQSCFNVILQQVAPRICQVVSKLWYKRARRAHAGNSAQLPAAPPPG